MLSPLPFAATLTLHAPHLTKPGEGFLGWLTNSILVSIIVSAFVIWFCRAATRQMSLVPHPLQNAFEAIIEGLYDILESIVGRHMIARTFPLLATLFIFILASNWFSLLPGVGSIGFGQREGGFFNVPHMETPLLRPTTADLNMTAAMALILMAFWLYWALAELGAKGLFLHTFGVKGGLKGLVAFALAPIFFFVGVIEVISIIFRPISLSLRLYGNIFAGENLLTAMITLGHDLNLPDWLAAIASITVPIPFYFLELLVGLLQAFVFMLLSAVYIQLVTTHDESEGAGH